MANYIEFTSQHRQNTFGAPVHDGIRPKSFCEIDGVRLDGEIIDFLDETIPDRLGRYFVESKKLRKRKILNDCVTFVALMNSVEFIGKPPIPFTNFDIEALPIEASESFDSPIILAYPIYEDVLAPAHVVQPAHLQNRENYLHKLGHTGPLCMSDLKTSMLMYECTSAHLAN